MSESDNQKNKNVPEFSALYDNNELIDVDKNNLIEQVRVEKELKNESICEKTEDQSLKMTEMNILNINEIEVASSNLLGKDIETFSSNDESIEHANLDHVRNILEPNKDERKNNIDISSERIVQTEIFDKNHKLKEKDDNSEKTNLNESIHKNGDVRETDHLSINESLISHNNSLNDSLTILKDGMGDNQNLNESFQNSINNLLIGHDINEKDQNQVENHDITQLETDNKNALEISGDNKSDDVTHSDVEDNIEVEQKQTENVDFISQSEANAHVDESQNSIDKELSDEALNISNITKVNPDEIKSDDKVSEAENFVDILGNGLLTKKIIVHGLGRETRPTHGDSVTIQYRGWNSSGELIEDSEASFVLGDGDMIQAFDLGICLAERHEEFELKTDARFAYGSYGCEPHVQPNEALVYRIKLLRVDDPPDYTTFTYQDRMNAADVKRERGNYLYRREEYSLAVNSYSRAIKIIQTDPDYKKASTDSSKADMYDLFVKVTNNLAAAQLKLESYDNVIETCNTLLNYDASNVKALFRKGKSLTMKGNYDEAIPILKRALELENSKLIAGEIQRCYQLKRAEDEQRARVCRKMFGTGVKNLPEKSQESVTSNWKTRVHKYYPFIGAVTITVFSIFLASMAIAKSKGN